MACSRSILVVDDNKGILASLQYLLGDRFAHVICLSSPQGILSLLERQAVDVVLLDMNFSAGLNSGGEGLFYLQEIKARHPHIPVVLFTAFADISLAVEGLKRGAADFVVKPYDNARLLQTLEEACTTKSGTRPKRNAPTRNGTDMYWGTSAAMQQLRTQVERCSATDANILITGENGTGKEVLAREIHAASHRKEGPLIAVDMGAIAPTLFESELFGHVKGAFTDARQDHEGRFEAARGGTLFLDEIGNLPLHLQAKLLTALQSRQVVRVGSNTPADVDIRLVCATNKDLPAMVEHGEFREDLLYRINTIHLHLPALRERREDILPLARRFLQRYAREYSRSAEDFSPEAAGLLERHPWYGNIRELQHAVERAVILGEGRLILPEQLNLSARTAQTETPSPTPRTLEETEREAVKQALDYCKGNFSLAASRLGISRQTLYNKIKRYGL